MIEEKPIHKQWRKNISNTMKKVWARRKAEESDKEEMFQERMAKQGGYEKP